MVEIIESTPRRLVLRKSDRDMRLLLLGGLGMSLLCCLIVKGAFVDEIDSEGSVVPDSR